MPLSRLEAIDIRDQWEDEAQDFTPWLAKYENIQVLSDAIGVDIEVEETEKYIGSYKADIVARDNEGRTVLIENQLNKTDHKHLGQLITYASGLGASIVIWICRAVTDEHREAIDWLNNVTTSEVAFFVCEIELWKIGESDPAPKFNIVSSPNDWSKTVRGNTGSKVLSDTKKLHLEFWNSFKTYTDEHDSELRLRTPRAQHWYSLAVGRSKFSISLTTNTQAKRVGCELYLRGTKAKEAFALLIQQKQEIESELGNLEWQELPEGQDCRIIRYHKGNTKNRKEWETLNTWLLESAESFYRVFSPRVKKLVVD